MFDFEDSFEAERVLARGSRKLKVKVLHLEWTLKVGCLLKGGFAKEVWVRVLGRPLHM